MKRPAWLLYLVLGALLTLGYLFVRALNVGPLFNLIALSSPVVILLAVRWHKPDQRLPWYLFALGQTLFVGGDVITYNYERFFHAPLPFPSVGDVPYLSVYPCLIAGILLLIHYRTPGRDRSSLIDSLIIAIAVGVFSWVLLMAPTAHDSTLSLVGRLISIAYPLMDLLLLAVVVRLAVGAGRREPAFYLLVASVVTLLATDGIYGWILLNNPNGYTNGGLLDGGWALFYLLWGAAALHPSMRTLCERTRDVDSRLSRGRLALLTGAALLAQGVRVVEMLLHRPVDLWVITGSSVALFLLVLARMSGLLHEQEQSAKRERTLRAAGAALVTATSRENIYVATLAAARTLAGDKAAVRVLAANGAPEFTVVAAAGGEEHVIGHSVQLAALPPAKLERLLAHQPFQVSVEESHLAPALAMPADTAFVFTAPLFMKDELKGLLSVAVPSVLPREMCDGLETLASKVALALESAALTEDLHRRQSEARFSSLVQNSSDIVTVIEPDTTVSYVSPSVERVLGWTPTELEGTRIAELIHPEDRTYVLSFLSTALGEVDPHAAPIELRLRHSEGFWVNVETLVTNLLHDPNVRGIVLNTRDIEERKSFEQQIQHQALHDSVTGLANRALFRDRVEHALSRRDETQIAILLMDIDDFKTVNDSLGPAFGDRLLAEVGERLKTCLRAADTAARMGGDEFAVLLEDPGHGVEAADVAARILAGLEGPFQLDDKEVFLRATIGIATAEGSSSSADGTEEILRNADVAMYMAKEAGKGRYQVFEPAMHDSALRRLELKADLQRAIENHEFLLHYQPVIQLGSGQITGFEALLRWMHPTRGLVQPLDFIPLAEETGLIVPIGRWVLEEACRQAVVLQQGHPSDPPLHISVNLSARQLQRPEIVAEVAKAVMDSGLDPGTLVLEITESVMMRDMELSISRLLELKELGVLLAVDDFGTGYSSLNYIRRFPVDILKVDKSFIDKVQDDGEDAALTEKIIELAGILKLRPIAEGIERPDQLQKLLDLECDMGQGFYFARPLPPEAVEELLAARSALEDRELSM